MRFRDLDIPGKLADLLEAQGFRELYPPQEKALPVALSGKSLVAAVPTASGKTMIGMIPALSVILSSGKKVLYIVPLKALATEKRDDFSKFSELGVKAVALTGDPDRDDDVSGADVVIATSEKADSMIRHGNKWVRDVGLLIADEVHMINDPGRGPTLEVAMTKMMHRNPGLQVIALSATISNAHDLSDWLNAKLIHSDWRPTELKEGVYFDGMITFSNYSHIEVPKKKDEIAAMVEQTVNDGGQCLVFVNSRRSAESVAYKLKKPLESLCGVALSDAERGMLEGGAESTSVGKKLAECVASGVAFHHAGLEYNQRRMVEEGFRNRTIKCIVATPTLAAGINLPARRVIVRDTTRFESNAGNVPIPVMEVKQMCGRAGRPGYDPWGEAVLIAKNDRDEDRLMDDYINHDTERLISKLGNENTLRTHILSLIATEDTNTVSDIKEFIDMTYFGSTSDTWGIETLIEDVVDYLVENDMVEMAGDLCRALPFGKRVSDLYIDPRSAVILRKAVEKVDEDTEDILIFQAVAATPDVLGMYPKKGDADMLAQTESAYSDMWLVSMEDEGGSDYEVDMETHMANLKTAVMMRFWVEEKSEDAITEILGIGPGDIRARVDTADWLLYGMSEIAYIFNPDAVSRIKPLLTRVRYGIKQELIPLVSIRGVGRSRARTLFENGYQDRMSLSSVDVRALASLPGIGKALANSIKKQVGDSVPEPPPMPDMDEDELNYMMEKMAAEEDAKNNQSSLDSF